MKFIEEYQKFVAARMNDKDPSVTPIAKLSFILGASAMYGEMTQQVMECMEACKTQDLEVLNNVVIGMTITLQAMNKFRDEVLAEQNLGRMRPNGSQPM